MNNDRRRAIRDAIALLGEVQAKIADALEFINQAAEEEREFFDNMPESLQQGERGQQADRAADQLEEAQQELDGFSIDDILSMLEEAMG